MDPERLKYVYVVNERAGRSFWSRIGVAFVNTDGSLSVKLEAIPVSGEMQIRKPKERGERIDDTGTAHRPLAVSASSLAAA